MGDAIPIIFFSSLALGLLPATIAVSKGRNFFVWYIYGALLFFVAVIHAIVIKPNENAKGMRKCSSCASVISEDARICPACRTQLDVGLQTELFAARSQVKEKLFNGERNTSSVTYQLFLTKKYTIEKNSTLEKYTIDEFVFDTLQDALTEADLRYADALTAIRESALKNEERRFKNQQIDEKEAMAHAEFIEAEAKQLSIRVARRIKIITSWIIGGMVAVIFVILFEYIYHKDTRAAIKIFSTEKILGFEIGVNKLNEIENKIGHKEVKPSISGYLVKFEKNDLINLKVTDELYYEINAVTFYYCIPMGMRVNVADQSTYKRFVLTGFSIDYGGLNKNTRMLEILLSKKMPEMWSFNPSLERILDVSEDGLRLRTIHNLVRRNSIDVCGNY